MKSGKHWLDKSRRSAIYSNLLKKLKAFRGLITEKVYFGGLRRMVFAAFSRYSAGNGHSQSRIILMKDEFS